MLHPREDYQRIQDPAGLIPENEPVFLMRAQDKVAARTVRNWADVNADTGGDPKLSRMAREHADKMDAWPVKKFADLPERSTAAPPAEPAAESETDTDPLTTVGDRMAERMTKPPTEPATEAPAKPESKPGSGVA